MSGAATDQIAALDALADRRGIALERDVPLAPLTTLRVGGQAERLATPSTVDELLAVLETAREAGVPAGVLGKGSDIVVADAGIRGLVIRNRADRIAIESTTLRAESGAAMAAVVKRAASSALAGIEFGISVPGSVGGAVWANAGAHGGEMKDVLTSVEVWATDRGRVTLAAAECAFAYRESRFKHTGEVVLSAILGLRNGDAADIARRVADHQAQRSATQPLADQNAGSVFRNPPGDYAGRLIEAAGLKGHQLGTAQVSTLHANFIVTARGARAADVRALGDHVRAVVEERFGVRLEYEIEFVGEWERGAAALAPSGLAGVP